VGGLFVITPLVAHQIATEAITTFPGQTLSALLRIYQRLGIMRARLSKAARLGSFSSPEALFV
jgi:hypothetical protein